MADQDSEGSEPVPIEPSLLEWAEYWYPISWKGVLGGGIITAIGACATIAFLLLQWRTTSIREELSDWRTSVLETQSLQAKADLGKAQADLATARADIERSKAEIARANEGTANANARIAELSTQAEQLRKDTADANVLVADAQVRIAGLNKDTARLQADNLALQTVLAPRHLGVIGINQAAPVDKWFAGLEQFAGTKVLLQTTPNDPEAANLANEIAIGLSARGWQWERIDEKRTGYSMVFTEGISVVAPSSYKAWTATDPAAVERANVARAAISLARALTSAGLGVGSYPVSGSNGQMMVVDYPPDSDAAKTDPFRNFSPKPDGVYVQVGARPVNLTLQWIKQGRPDIAGNPPDDINAQ